MNRDEIVAELFRLQDKKYAEMQTRIIPTVQPDRIIGVRTPELRTFAGKLYRDEGKDFAKMFHGLLLINKFHNCKFHVFTNVKIF